MVKPFAKKIKYMVKPIDKKKIVTLYERESIE